jgi:membrane-associated phospholipid phosphatase
MKFNPVVWKIYIRWFVLVSAVFFAVYPLCNWLTAQRDPATVHTLYTQAELNLPFVPLFIWGYFSLYALFFIPPFFLEAPVLQRLGGHLLVATLISGVIFLLFPCRLGFIRHVPDDPFYAAIFSHVFALDLPFNTIPSLHVVFSALIIGTLVQGLLMRKRHYLRWFFWGWLGLICISTLLVHQHHLADIVAGLFLALLLKKVWSGEFSWRTRRNTAC